MDNCILNEKSLIYHIKQYRVKKHMSYYDEIGSTNDEAKKLCNAGKGKGALLVSDCQTQGKGRLGRSFESAKGVGVYFSTVYELDDDTKNLDLISSVAGLAVRDSLYNIFNIDAKIKWPNDILVDDKKICGILCEIVNQNNKPKYIIIGIGINVEKQDFPEEIQYTATTIADNYEGEEKIDHNELVIDVIHNLDRYLLKGGVLNGEDTSDIINRLKMHSATLEKMVRVITPDTEYDARALNINEAGALVVDSAEGEKVISSGEIVHLR